MSRSTTGLRSGALVAGLIALTAAISSTVVAQEEIQLVISARDAEGRPVTDLTPYDVVIVENGVGYPIQKVEPFHIPVKVTIAVDNGILSREALGQYRSGLEGLVNALPADVEVAVISMAPQPRFVVPSTVDRTRILRGINAMAPEQATPRFADTLVEYAKRLEDAYKKTKRFDFLPVLVLVATSTPEHTSYAGATITSAVQRLISRRVKVYVAMTTILQGAGADTGQESMLAIPLAEANHGRYEALANPTRLTTLLPEFGADIASLHRLLDNQILVTAIRQIGVTGPLQNFHVELRRANLRGHVSLDGLP